MPLVCGRLDPGGAVGDVLELEEQLVGMLVGRGRRTRGRCRDSTASISAAMLLEGGQDVVVQQLHRRDRQLVGVEPRPGVARMAVDHGLQVDLAHALERADEEGVDRDQRAGVRGLDVALAELRAEALQQPAPAPRSARSVRSAVVFSSRSSRSCLVSRSWRLQTPRTPPEETWRPRRRSSCSTRIGAVAGMGERVVEHRLPRSRTAPGWGAAPLAPGSRSIRPVGAIGLEVAPDLVELLP